MFFLKSRNKEISRILMSEAGGRQREGNGNVLAETFQNYNSVQRF